MLAKVTELEPDINRAREQYSRQAEYYTRSTAHSAGETLGLVVEWAQSRPDHKALDIATGTGFTAFALAPRVAYVVGYDLTAEMLGQAKIIRSQRGLTNVGFVQGVAETLPFGDGSFDIVVCRTAPHHFQSIDSFMAESRRVVKSGGQVIVVDTSVPGDPVVDEWQNMVELMRDPSHVKNLSIDQWQALFKKHRLEIDNSSKAYRTPLEFWDWVERSGTASDTVKELHNMFLGALPAVKDAFHIEERDGKIHFSWVVAALSGRKLED
ncbi:MAG: methyltransferase domain-containing protein [Dehalococcoidia bacterium]|nr:methyltransferase domain-containing protein [Dehalococcoidia bacterium]